MNSLHNFLTTVTSLETDRTVGDP